MRYLVRSFAIGALRRGKDVEQFLGGFQHDDRPGIRWTTLSPGSDGITVYLHEVEDVGSETFLDITEFPAIHTREEEDFGLGQDVAVVATPEEALDLAERRLRALPDRWVNQGVIGSEYQDYRATHKAPPRRQQS